jgi:hypothetical protein
MRGGTSGGVFLSAFSIYFANLFLKPVEALDLNLNLFSDGNWKNSLKSFFDKLSSNLAIRPFNSFIEGLSIKL